MLIRGNACLLYRVATVWVNSGNDSGESRSGLVVASERFMFEAM